MKHKFNVCVFFVSVTFSEIRVIQGSHSSVGEDSSLLCCYSVLAGKYF